MLKLLEDDVKAWLGRTGLPVPAGVTANSAKEASAAMGRMPDGAVLKALVPAGRRGKSGAVQLVGSEAEALAAANAILGSDVGGFIAREVYVEERIDFDKEYFLSFLVQDDRSRILISAEGGVEIETLFAERPEAVISEPIDPIRGLTVWDAIELWTRVGMSGADLRELAGLTCALYRAFVAGDALTLELNPIVKKRSGGMVIVGAMAGIDDAAVARHPQWAHVAARANIAHAENPREERVRQTNEEVPGGECQYTELDGTIGLIVGGGGAGLYQHDLVIDMGARPANHCVTPPTGSDRRKLREVIRAVVTNPKVEGLLVGFNFAQMARADIRIQSLVEILDEENIDTEAFPIVIRMFGAGEDMARSLVAGRAGVEYLPRGASLEDGVRRIVEKTSAGGTR